MCTVKCFPQIQRASLGEKEMLALAYETAKAVNTHFYLSSKLFMSIFPLYATNTWGSEQVRSLDIAVNKQGLSLFERLLHTSWLNLLQKVLSEWFGAYGTSWKTLSLCFKDIEHNDHWSDDITSGDVAVFSHASGEAVRMAMSISWLVSWSLSLVQTKSTGWTAMKVCAGLLGEWILLTLVSPFLFL